jgi:hypothetical protein
MSQQIQTYSITAPGFYGLNTQDSSLDLASGFALVANNCVIDKYGRIGARKGWAPKNSSTGTLGSNDVKLISQLLTEGGLNYTVVAGNNKLFILDSGTLTELTYGGGGSAPTISDSNWQAVQLSNCLYLFQSGHDPLVFDPAVSTSTYRRVSEKSGYTGTILSGNTAISAFGRLWVADSTTNKDTVYFSDLLSGHVWSGGTSGYIDISQYWPNGSDNIVALASHNNFLIIFGRNNVLVYSNANDPSAMSLSDSVTGIGCIARDSIANTGTDVVFLSDTGVRSILRTIQEKSAPFRDLSKNVRDDLMSAVASEVANHLKSVYNPVDSFYLLSLPTSKVVYCFDLRGTLQDGSARVTIWTGIEPKSFWFDNVNKEMLLGKTGYVGKYSTYLDNTSTYRFQYFTNHTDLGAPSVTSMLKKLSVVVIGGTNQYVFMKWGYDFTSNYYSQTAKIPDQGVDYYGESEYNIAQYSGGTALQTLVAYPTGSGKVVQTGYEADINGSALSIQKLEIQAKNGKIV